MPSLKLFQLPFLLVIVIFVQSALGDFVTIDTPLGSLRGSDMVTNAGTTLYRFLGVPYAEPPVGPLRFKAPVAVSAWNETRDALTGYACMQLQDEGIQGSEDCLYLNVFTPELPSNTSSLKPVLVEIHGGCFIRGSARTQPRDFLIDSGIVYVAINYRVSALGFMSTGDMLLPGNLGLKDQLLALRWVQSNIAAFGGDPDDVTIFGQSAGSASVHYLLLSSLSQGLFRRAIAASGSALNPWAFDKNATDRTFRYASYLGYTAQNTTDLMDFLMNVEASELVKETEPALSEEDSNNLFICVWVPSVEPEHDGAILTEEPWVLVSEGRYSYLPYLTGITSYELLTLTQEDGAFSTEGSVQALNDNFDAYVAHDLRLQSTEEQLQASTEIRQYYYGDNEITLATNDSTATMASDLMFAEGVDTVVRYMVQHSTEPVYYYQFSFNGPLNKFPDFPGACHADDMNYFGYETLDSDSSSYLIGLQMTELWTNFIKQGNPTPGGSSAINVTWGIYTAEETNYLEYLSPLRVGTGLNEDRMDFWHNVVP